MFTGATAARTPSIGSARKCGAVLPRLSLVTMRHDSDDDSDDVDAINSNHEVYFRILLVTD